jgi:hypothetical protein
MTNDDLQSLRADIEQNPPENYPRPALSNEEEQKYVRVALKLNSIRDQRLRLLYMSTMIYENARLLKEVNEHRAARGLELLPSYDPEAKK